MIFLSCCLVTKQTFITMLRIVNWVSRDFRFNSDYVIEPRLSVQYPLPFSIFAIDVHVRYNDDIGRACSNEGA